MSDNRDYISDLLEKINMSDFPEKLSLLTRSAQTYPDDHRILLLLAGVQAQAQKFDCAEATYIDILRTSPHYAIARFQLGLLQFTSSRPAAAFATWKPLDQLDENDPLWLFKRAFEYLAQDQFAAAVHYLRQGIACNSSNPPLNEDMRLLLARISETSGIKDETSDRTEAGHTNGNVDETPASAPASEAHFLVSAYRNLH
jgi:tetratricopeptide (TPR) repeat protein